MEVMVRGGSLNAGGGSGWQVEDARRGKTRLSLRPFKDHRPDVRCPRLFFSSNTVFNFFATATFFSRT